jgi:hypothetical protein
MQTHTRSILKELDALYTEKKSVVDERQYVVENKASNVIASAIRLLEHIEQVYTPEQAEYLTRKLINAIRFKDPGKFTRSVKRTNAD